MKPSQIFPSEYNPYYKGYMDLLEEMTLSEALKNGLSNTKSFFQDLPGERLNYSYAEGKWTPKDILQHITDTERVFAYRALSFARSENANLAGFDENIFAENALAGNKTLSDLLDEYIAVRTATILLFKNLTHQHLTQIGTANGSKMSVRAIGFIICGHEIHHCNIIKERYLS